MPAATFALLNDEPKPSCVQGRARCSSGSWSTASGSPLDLPQAIVERHDCLPPLLALAGRDHDCVVIDMRPGQAQQVASRKPGMRGKVDGVRDLHAAGGLNADDIGVGPDDSERLRYRAP